MDSRGLYIVIEGPDGTGKTTQADKLEAYFAKKNIPAIHLKEPGGTPIGEAIRGILLDATLGRTPMTNLLLFTSNRHELWFQKIKPTLEQGITVIATRNYWSSLAFQGYGEGMDIPVIEAITSTFTEQAYMKPDIGIVLNFDNEATRRRRLTERGALDIFEQKPKEFQNSIIQGYQAIAAAHGAHEVDAEGTIDEVHRRVAQAIEDSQNLFIQTALDT